MKLIIVASSFPECLPKIRPSQRNAFIFFFEYTCIADEKQEFLHFFEKKRSQMIAAKSRMAVRVLMKTPLNRTWEIGDGSFFDTLRSCQF
ncbi:hypothetical protein [Enterococcus sp.]|uniref:hypothetical protein n=1 Tax=Enterococcus sp. TaxID=35783 RepID=UPI003C745D55